MPEHNKTIIASKCQLYLPIEQQLIDEAKKEMENLDERVADYIQVILTFALSLV